jgi:micrococcal nuclease
VDRRRATAYVGLALVAGFALGFLAGRFTSPRKEIPSLPARTAEGPPQPSQIAKRSPEHGRVTRLLGADALEVAGIGKVRMIGVDIPPGKTLQEAKAFLEKQALGREVRLEFDPRYPDGRNEAGELLAYVYTQDGKLLNTELISQGYAFVRASEPFQLVEEFRAREREAVREMRGVWGATEAAAPDKNKRLVPLLPSEIGPPIAATQPEEPMVFVAPGDKMYHKEGCEYLGKKKRIMPLSQARAEGYLPCSRCYASTVLKVQ